MTKKWRKSHRMTVRHCRGARPASGKHLFYGCSYWAVWTAQAGWGLPDGVVSSPSSTGTPTKTRPPGPEIGRDWPLPVWTSPAMPSQARVGSLGKTAVPRSSDDCPGVHLNA